jgi:hypothetical protein
MRIAPMFASDFGAIGVASVFMSLFIIASLTAGVSFLLTAFRRTRGLSIWFSTLSLLAGLVLFGFYLFVLRKQGTDWVVIPLSVSPSLVSALALWWGVSYVRTKRADTG